VPEEFVDWLGMQSFCIVDAVFLADPATSQYAVGVVKDGGLTGGDGALWGVEDDACGCGVKSFYGCS
jgi:hypothetical protein